MGSQTICKREDVDTPIISRRKLIQGAVALPVAATIASDLGWEEPVWAYDKDGNKAFDWIYPLNIPSVPRSFMQGNKGKENADGVPDYYTLSLGSNGLNAYFGGLPCSVGVAGCTTFAGYNMYLKAGVIPMEMKYAATDQGEDTFYKRYIITDKLVTSEGGFVWTSAEENSEGKLKRDGWVNGLDGIVQALKTGESAVAMIHVESPLGQHWVFGEDITEDGKVIIVDSGWGHHFLPAPESYSVVHGAHIYSMTDKKRADTELLAGIGADGSRTKNDAAPKNNEGDKKEETHDASEATEGNAKPLDELDLDGMEGRKKYEMLAEDPNHADGRGFIPPDALDVPSRDKANLSQMRDDIKASKQGEQDSFVRTGSAIVGIVGFVYGIVVMCAYLLSKGGGFGHPAAAIAPSAWVDPNKDTRKHSPTAFILGILIVSLLIATGILTGMLGNIINVLISIFKR